MTRATRHPQGRFVAYTRRDIDRIGVNIEEDTPVAIYTSTPVTAFIEAALASVLRDLGPKVNHDARLALRTSIEEFYVVESHLYRGSVRLRISLFQGRRELWTGIVRGSDTAWGRSLRSENYAEVLSEAASEALIDAFTSPGFQEAVSEAGYEP